MAEKKHAVLSPSSSSRWLTCPASVALSKDIPNESSAYAEEGTRAHELAERVTLAIANNEIPPPSGDAEMQEAALAWAEVLTAIVKGKDVAVFEAECELPLESVTGEVDSFGTADALVIADDILHVVDFKYGRGVKVDAEQNTQLAIYALAALDCFGMFCEIKGVELHIVQPRLNHFAHWAVSLEDLKSFGEAVAERSALALALYADPSLVTDEDFDADCAHCQFCLAKSKCPKLAERTRQSVIDALPMLEPEQKAELENVLVVPTEPEQLARAYGALDAIELWVKTVRESMLARLKQGEAIQGYKLVSGKPGNRRWRNENEAELLLKKMRIKEPDMYERKVISPTKAEKLSKSGVIGPRQWPQLQELIERPDGKPSVAREDDPRPAITLAHEDFQEEAE